MLPLVDVELYVYVIAKNNSRVIDNYSVCHGDYSNADLPSMCVPCLVHIRDLCK